MHIILDPKIHSLPLIKKGKVRSLYRIDSQLALMVASDRLSVFDIILSQGIPFKGTILTKMSSFWFNELKKVVLHHSTNIDPIIVVTKSEVPQIKDRSVVVKTLKPIPIEAIVRGYLCGQAWTEYQENNTVHGTVLPKGLFLGDPLPESLFCPSTKAEVGEKDVFISFKHLENMIGTSTAEKIREISFLLYRSAATLAWKKGYVLADCKFEFGWDSNNNLCLMDEACTPDCSRYWLRKDHWCSTPEYLDKQMVRNYLTSIGWSPNDTSIPSNLLPPTIIEKMVLNYHSLYKGLTGNSIPHLDGGRIPQHLRGS